MVHKFTKLPLTLLLVLLTLACRLPTPPALNSPVVTATLTPDVTVEEPPGTPPAPTPSSTAWTRWIVAISGGGLFLLLGFIALVGLLWWQVSRRRRTTLGPAATPPKTTARLNPAESRPKTAVLNPTLPLTPLPEGSLLYHKQFRVRKFEQQAGDLNIYTARSTEKVRICVQCKHPTPDVAERFCAQCGNDLHGIAEVWLGFVVQEAAEEGTFATPAQLLLAQFHHPGVRLPVAVFAEDVGDGPRYYQVTAEYRAYRAAQLPLPQPLANVLVWGAAMARGMAALHAQSVVLRTVDLEHLLVEEGVGQCVCTEQVQTLTGLAPEQARQLREQDVQRLAASLQQLIGAAAELPPEVAALFTQLRDGTLALTAEAFAVHLEQAAHALQRPEQVRLLVGQSTDVGRTRALNEDNLLVVEQPSALRHLKPPVGFYAVADGMGGHAAGDVASRVTVETLAQLANDRYAEGLDTAQWLEQVAQAANREVFEQGRAAHSDMGCTLVMAVCEGDAVTVANVGDSRAYHLTPQGIHQITVDHSLVERLVAAGQITPEEARTHPQRNVVYRVIGNRAELEADHFNLLVAPGEAILLCSDGLSGMILDEQIWQIWLAAADPQAACERLVDAANAAGGNDNITVIIVQVSG